jgi:Tol biopolymer transport system component
MKKKAATSLRPAAWAVSLIALASATTVTAKNWDDWSAPASLESLPGSSTAVNTPAVDGCASHSQDGLTIIFNSNRGGADQDLYMATRSSKSEGFGTPVRLPAPVNTSANEACATIATGNRLYFSSDRDDPAYDIYVTKRGPNGWSKPANLGPNINTPGWLDEAAAFYDDGGNEVMLFSSRGSGGAGDGNIYESVNRGPKSLLAGGPNSSASDNRPSVTRDGLTIFFDSTRTGSLGGPDLYYATRSSTSQPFGTAIHLQHLSSPAFDARAVISKDGSFLTFSSGRSGSESPAPDIWLTTRDKVTGN